MIVKIFIVQLIGKCACVEDKWGIRLEFVGSKLSHATT